MSHYRKNNIDRTAIDTSHHLVNGTTYDHVSDTTMPIHALTSVTGGTTDSNNKGHSNSTLGAVPHLHERFYDVTICPDAGRVTVMTATSSLLGNPYRPTGQRNTPTGEPSDESSNDASSAPYRARRILHEYAVANQLQTFVTLTYEIPPTTTESSHALTTFLRRVSRKGGAPWAAVSEYGKQNDQIHHHVLLHDQMKASVVERSWPLGIADVAPLEDHSDIRRVAVYMTKDFALPKHQRPERNRYRLSRRGRHPKRFHLYLTRRELDEYLRERGITGVEWWHHHDPNHRLRSVGTWNPH